MLKYLISYKLFETKSNIKFKLVPPKSPTAKTSVYEVIRDGIVIGLIKWSSRMRGYGFLPKTDDSDEIQTYIKNLNSEWRANRKKKS
jgi:predicted RNA-binding protein with PUA domain